MVGSSLGVPVLGQCEVKKVTGIDRVLAKASSVDEEGRTLPAVHLAQDTGAAAHRLYQIEKK